MRVLLGVVALAAACSTAGTLPSARPPPAAPSKKPDNEGKEPALESEERRPLEAEASARDVENRAPNDNERLGLDCFGRAARFLCSDSDEPTAGSLLVLVDDQGSPLEEEFRDTYLCGPVAQLYGCNDLEGHEVIPFDHRRPIAFKPSGFAMVEEQYRGDCGGGWFYVDARYDQKVEAVGEEGIPDGWIPIDIVRYKKDGLIGFLDLRTGIVTPPRFGAALRFEGGGGQTLVCEGCHPERWGYCPPPEAHCTGEAFLINEKGQRLQARPDSTYREYWWCQTNPGRRDVPASLTFCP